jgi:hypothetical protein
MGALSIFPYDVNDFNYGTDIVRLYSENAWRTVPINGLIKDLRKVKRLKIAVTPTVNDESLYPSTDATEYILIRANVSGFLGFQGINLNSTTYSDKMPNSIHLCDDFQIDEILKTNTSKADILTAVEALTALTGADLVDTNGDPVLVPVIMVYKATSGDRLKNVDVEIYSEFF